MKRWRGVIGIASVDATSSRKRRADDVAEGEMRKLRESLPFLAEVAKSPCTFADAVARELFVCRDVWPMLSPEAVSGDYACPA
eukprot:3450825-Prymnesium_polylepis.1